MGGMVDSAGGFLGLSDGPKAPEGNFHNPFITGMEERNGLYHNAGAQRALDSYGAGQGTTEEAMAQAAKLGMPPEQMREFGNAMATGATTGSRYATEQVQNNPILGQLFGKGGEMSKLGTSVDQARSKEQELQNQGYRLNGDDMSAYGQASGNISRLFGQQENAAASNLASRGLSSSGAAGAKFSGLAGNKNEMLAGAQKQIMDQRVQDTMKRIGQQQQFIGQQQNALGQMGSQGASAINQQHGRQMQGAQFEHSKLFEGANAKNAQNQASNAYNMDAANFEQDNKPENFMDQSIRNSDTASSAFSKSLGQAGGSMAGGGMGG